MKEIHYFPVITVVFFFTQCTSSKDIDNMDILGHWWSRPSPIHGFYCEELFFSQDSVTFMWSGGLSITYSYQSKNNYVIIEGEQGSIPIGKYTVKEEELHFDTGIVLSKLGPLLISSVDLVGIETNSRIFIPDMCGRKLILYKDSIGATMIGMDDVVFPLDTAFDRNHQIVSHLDASTLRLYILVGKGVTLKDIINLYTLLLGHYGPNICQMEVVWCLSTDGRGKYWVFNDKICQFWKEDLDKLRPTPPFPPFFRDSLFPNRTGFLPYVDTSINIYRAEDINKLQTLERGKKYLVSFSNSLTLQAYIKAQEICRKQIDVFIKTEIRIE